MNFDLERFRQAQDRGDLADALAELRAGRKRSHWIWYVFPQLRGLGSSPYALLYGLDGLEEAEAYLGHPVLRSRLAEAVEAVHTQLRESNPPLATLLGSSIDAKKLVSSMTLFEAVARKLHTRQPDPELETLADRAEEVLAAAEAQGHRRCAFTLERLAAG